MLYAFAREFFCNFIEPNWLVGKVVGKDEYHLIGSAKYVGILNQLALDVRFYCLLIDVLHYVSHCAAL